MAEDCTRILIAEDDYRIAWDLADMLEGMDFAVLGPLPSLDETGGFADREEFDAAVSDVRLDGGAVTALSKRLAETGKPALRISGAPAPDELRHLSMLEKPISREALKAAVRAAFGHPARMEAAAYCEGATASGLWRKGVESPRR